MQNETEELPEIVGTWSYSSEHTAVNGVVQVKNGEIKLSLDFGVIEDQWFYESVLGYIDVLGGKEHSGRPITLIKCHAIESSRGGSGHVRVRYWCEELVHGRQLDHPDDNHFASASIVLDGGHAWAGRRSYEIGDSNQYDTRHDTILLFSRKEILCESMLDTEVIRLLFSNNFNFFSRTISCDTRFIIEITSNEGLHSIRHWRELIDKYRFFISILSGKKMSATEVYLFSQEKHDGGSRLIPPGGGGTVQEFKDIAFTFDTISQSFNQYLGRWSASYPKQEEICRVIFPAREDAVPVELDFLLHVQAIEAIYRSHLYEKPGGKLLSDFDTVKAELLKIIQRVEDNKFREAASKKLDHMNEFSLRDMMLLFMDSFHTNVVIALGINLATVKNIVSIRNSLTHMGRRRSLTTRQNGSEILRYTYMLRFLIILFLMKEIGLDEETASAHLSASDDFVGLLDYKLYHPRRQGDWR